MFGIQAILSTLVLAAVPSAEEATLLYTTTPGCAPCRQVAPLVQEFVDQGYSVEIIDASKHPDIIQQLGVDRFPTFLMLSGDRIIDRHVGAGDPAVLRQVIRQMYLKAETLQKSATAPQSTSAPVAGTVAQAAWNGQEPGSVVTARQDTTPNPIVPVSFASTQQTLPPSAVFSVETAPSSEPSPLIFSSVKLRVDAENTHSWGTGTIIDARDGEALVLTCGHIFRDSQGKGQVEVQLFGQDSFVKVYGNCIYYDLEIDLALVAIRPPGPVRAIPVAPIGYEVNAQQAVWSVGCDGGANPTVRTHQIMSTDRIGTPLANSVPFYYIQVSGAPVGGRSGGGLFTENGYLVGVCNTADPVENDGHFVPPQIIRQVLKSLRLEVVYEAPCLTDPRFAVAAAEARPTGPAPVPATSAPMIASQTKQEQGSLRPLHEQPFSSPTLPQVSESSFPNMLPAALENNVRHQENREEAPSNPLPAVAALPVESEEGKLSAVEKATLDEVRRRSQDGDEVILIVRSRRNPEMPSDVIVLNGTSEQFLDALSRRTPSPAEQHLPSYDPVILSSQDPAPGSASSPLRGSGPQKVSFPVLH